MLLIVTENLIEMPEIRMIGLAIVLWISMYSINWICSKLYDNGYDILGFLPKKKKKKKSRRRS